MAKKTKPIQKIIEENKPGREAYWNETENFLKKIKFEKKKINSLTTEIVDRFEKQKIPSHFCLSGRVLAADKFKTFKDLHKELYENQIFIPPTYVAKNITKEKLEELIFYSIYLFQDSEFQLIIKPRLGSQGSEIEAVEARNNDSYKIVIPPGKDTELKETELTNIDDLVTYITSKEKPKEWIIQSFAPAKIEDSTYDLRVLMASAREPNFPTIYMRSKKKTEDDPAITSNIAQGAKFKSEKDIPTKIWGKATDKSYLIYKLIENNIADKSLRVVSDGGVVFESTANLFNKKLILGGFDIAFMKPREEKPTEADFAGILPEKKVDELLNTNPLGRLLLKNTLEKMRKEDMLCIFYEYNTNPGFKGPVYIQDGHLAKRLAMELSRTLRDGFRPPT